MLSGNYYAWIWLQPEYLQILRFLQEQNFVEIQTPKIQPNRLF